MKFLLAIDHLASYNVKGYEYYEMEAENIASAKAKVLSNFHKFDQTYLIKILSPAASIGYLPICNIRSSGKIEAIEEPVGDSYRWTVEDWKIKSFDDYLGDWEERKEIIEKNHGNGIIGGQGRSKESIEASAAIVFWCLSASIVGLIIVLFLKLFK